MTTADELTAWTARLLAKTKRGEWPKYLSAVLDYLSQSKPDRRCYMKNYMRDYRQGKRRGGKVNAKRNLS